MAKLVKKLAGFKGGTTQKAPIEVEDTIQSTGKAYIVDLLCEGEIDSLVNLYIDEAVYNSTDFPTVDFSPTSGFRKGLRRTAQAPLSERYAGAKVPVPIPQSSELRKSRPIVINFNSNTYPDATSVLVNMKFPSLLRQVEESSPTYDSSLVGQVAASLDPNYKKTGEVAGDIREAIVEYHITLTENGVARPTIVEVVNEKSSGGFLWSTRVHLSPDPTLSYNQWKLKIERITPDSQSVKLSTKTVLDSVIIETSYLYNYPNSVIAAMSFDAQNYPSIGQRAYDVKLLKVKVPLGYTPTQYDSDGNVTAAASYPSIWGGGFETSKVWTDNPAWIFYDLLTNKRYGLGEFIEPSSIDKWTLYSISKYCDELVAKGNGVVGDDGLEPRFSCNLFLTTTEEAYTVINNLASVFRGITYWMSGKIFAVQDRIKDPVQLFTNANVINGLFNYSSSGKNQRRTAVTVRWNDPLDFYRPATEYVEDTEGVIRFGLREFDIGAFACTSRGQAYRVGKWSLLSERLETEIVNFDAGMDAIYTRPGDVIEIYDNFRALQKKGGRVYDMSDDRSVVTLDRIVETGAPFTYRLSLDIPKANRDPGYTGVDTSQLVVNSDQEPEIRKTLIETIDVIDMMYSGDRTICTVVSGYSEQHRGGIWTLETSHPTSGKIDGTKKYRVLNMKENEDKNVSLTVLEYDESKFTLAESGYTIRTSPTTNYTTSGIAAPTNLTLTQRFETKQENFSAFIEASWTSSVGPYLALHNASGRKVGDSGWSKMQVYDGGTKANYFPTNSGEYEVIINAVQVGGNVSSGVAQTITFGASNPLGTSVMPLSQIILDNADLDSTSQYSERVPAFVIESAPSGANGYDERKAFTLGTQFRFKDYAGVPKSDWFLIEQDERIELAYNTTGVSGWPFRSGTIEARNVDFWNNYSSTVSLAFSNPPPPSAALTVLYEDQDSFGYTIEPNGLMPKDFSGIYFYVNTTTSLPTGYVIKNSLAGEIVHNLGQDQIYAWWTLVDNFTSSGCHLNGPQLIDSSASALSISGVSVTLNRSGLRDAYFNEYNTLYATWNRIDNPTDIIDYFLYINDNSGSAWTYVVPQPDSGVNPFFHIPYVVPDRTYTAAIRSRNSAGRKSPLSSYSAGTAVPQPLTNYLSTNYLRTNRLVLGIYEKTIASGQNVDFSQGNIIKLNLTNSTSAVLTPINIQSGTSYMIHMFRQSNAGAVTFGSGVRWPEAEHPNFTLTLNAVDAVSAYAINNTTLYAVGAINLS